MKNINLAVVCFVTFFVMGIKAVAQKPVIDSSVYGKWASVSIPMISPDGKYAYYTIEKKSPRSTTFVLLATDGKWKKEFSEPPTNPWFTVDSKLSYANGQDSMCILTPGTEKVEYILNGAFYSRPSKVSNKWSAYQTKNTNQELVLQNLQTGKKKAISYVNQSWFSDYGETIVLEKKIKSNPGADSLALYWIDLSDGKMTEREIWKGSSVENLQFDGSGKQVVFEMKKGEAHTWWHYHIGMNQAVLLLESNPAGISADLFPDRAVHFSTDGKRMFFMLKRKSSSQQAKPDAVRLNVWSYFDAKVQAQQIQDLKESSPEEYLAIMDLNTHKLLRLQQETDDMPFIDYEIPNTYIVGTTSQQGDGLESHWNRKSKISQYIQSTIDGSRRSLNADYWNVGISGGGKFVLFFDSKTGQYLTYEFVSGIYRTISSAIPVPLSTTLNTRDSSRASMFGDAFWLKNDEAFLICDQYDIWQVDPLGVKAPVNLTNGYGRKHQVELRSIIPSFRNPIYKHGEKLVLTGFNRATKDNGFWSITLGNKKDPELLSSGPYTYYAPQKKSGSTGSEPQKAANADVWLVARESATECRNYFSTKDFKTFTPLTDLHPQRSYNWFTTELHTWKSLNGREELQGVLYKPENFDPNKKYPVIFYFYELLSDGLNSFIEPEAAEGPMNIPWYVSNGYLVFTPDIHYQIGEPMEGTYNSVVGAAEYLAKLPYVNAKKMGIQGHSFGGVQTNYLVTHTNLFAAACSADGISNFISHYGELSHGDRSCQTVLERGQIRVGATLWERPDWYIKNSPVMNADKVTTPFLMMHTSVDGACPFPQAVELFTDLRRLGKKVWLLEYEDGDHGVSGKSADDYSIRMSQFFDHYLKDKPAPKWMTRGIPAKRKGIDDGLELDTEIAEPEPGLTSEITRDEK